MSPHVCAVWEGGPLDLSCGDCLLHTPGKQWLCCPAGPPEAAGARGSLEGTKLEVLDLERWLGECEEELLGASPCLGL